LKRLHHSRYLPQQNWNGYIVFVPCPPKKIEMVTGTSYHCINNKFVVPRAHYNKLLQYLFITYIYWHTTDFMNLLKGEQSWDLIEPWSERRSCLASVLAWQLSSQMCKGIIRLLQVCKHPGFQLAWFLLNCRYIVQSVKIWMFNNQILVV
jgi:hypothetical protein